ncbi:rRNA-processing protein UTP23, partial [Tanacetum coccineum]
SYIIDQSFCRHMLRQGIRKQDLCDLLLSKDVELNITSCNIGELMRFEIENEDQRKAALIELALCLNLLRCDHLNSSLNASECVERFVQNGNPRYYFVATTDKSFVKDLLELPGVAVISVKRGGKLVLKEASLSQKKFAKKNTKESRKRKVIQEDTSLRDEGTHPRLKARYFTLTYDDLKNGGKMWLLESLI